MEKKIRTQPSAVEIALIGLVTALALTGCGSSMKPRDGAVANSASTSAGAECNQFSSLDTILAGKVTTYYTSGMMQEDRARLRLTSLADSFSQSSTTSIQFFRWAADSTGTTRIDPTPLSFTIELSSVYGNTPISSNLTSLTLANLNAAASTGMVSASSIAELLSKVAIVIQGTDYNWNALKVVYYNGTTTVGQSDVLLPIISANPNTYAATHAPVLAQLHPFWAQRGQALSDADWVNMSKNFCF